MTVIRTIAAFALALVCAQPAHGTATLLPNGMQCFAATTPQSGGQYGPISTLGAIVGGSGYTNGTYANVALTGGSGRGATATITVQGGAVTGVSITNAGAHFTAADAVTAAANLIGGGTGFNVPVATVTGTGTGMVGLLGPLRRGAGGRDGGYGGVALQGGAGQGATANITVRGGRVDSVAITDPGASYQVGDVLTANPGGVIGLEIPVSSVMINQSLGGGSVYMFVPNTTNAKQTWQDSKQTVLNQNPVTLDANGCAVMYGTGVYRQVLTDQLGNIVWDKLTTDTSVQDVEWAGTALNSSTPNLAILTDPGFNATDGSIVSFIPTQQNTGGFAVSFNNTTYTNIPVLLDMINGPQPLTGGEIAPGNIVVMIYSASENTFHLINSAQAASLDLLNQQVQSLVAAFNQAPTTQNLLSGQGTYTPTTVAIPPGATAAPTVLYDKVLMCAGGGGAAGANNAGSSGGNTTFNDWSVIGGHPGQPPQAVATTGLGGVGGSGGADGTGVRIGRWQGGAGSGSGSASGLTGGSIVFAGGVGGSAFAGGNGGGDGVAAGANTGGGGGAQQTQPDAGGAGGGGGGECVAFIWPHPTPVAYSVGVGGGGAPGGDPGAAGGIWIEEYFH